MGKGISAKSLGLERQWGNLGSSPAPKEHTKVADQKNYASIAEASHQELQALTPKSNARIVTSKLFLDPEEAILPNNHSSFPLLSHSEQAWQRFEAGETIPIPDIFPYLEAPDVLKTKFLKQPTPFKKLIETIREKKPMLQEDLPLAQYVEEAFLNYEGFRKELTQAFGDLPFQLDGKLKPEVGEILQKELDHYNGKVEAKSEQLQKSLLEQVLDPKASLKNRTMAYFASQALKSQTAAFEQLNSSIFSGDELKALSLHVQSAQAYEKLYALSGKSDHAQAAASAYYQAGRLIRSSEPLEVIGDSKEFFLSGVRILQELPAKFHHNGQILQQLGDGLSQAGYDAEAIQVYDRAYSSAIPTKGTRVEVASQYKAFRNQLEEKAHFCLRQDKTKQALKNIHEQLQSLGEKKGKLTAAEQKKFRQLREAISLARRASAITLPGKVEETEPSTLTKIRDQVIGQLKGELSDEVLEKVETTVERFENSTNTLYYIHALRVNFLHQQYPDYVIHHLSETGDWSLLRLNYEGATDLPKHWNPTRLNSKGFARLQEKSPEHAKQVSEIVKIFQRPNLISQDLEDLDALEAEVGKLKTTVFESQPISETQSNQATTPAAYENVLQPKLTMHASLKALFEATQEVKLRTEPGFWLSDCLSKTQTNLQAIETILQDLKKGRDALQAQQDQLNSAKLGNDPVKTEFLEQAFQLVQSQQTQLEGGIKDFIQTRAKGFKEQIAEYHEHAKRLGLLGIDKAAPFANELAQALKQIENIEQNLDTQDLPASLRKLQHSEALLYQAVLFTQGAALKEWKPGNYAYYAKLDKTEWVSDHHWEQAIGDLKQNMALADSGPINVAQVLKAGEDFQRSIDASAFKRPEERLEELVTTHLKQWYGVCDEMKKHSEDTMAIEQLIGLFEKAKTSLKKGNFAAARAIYQKATESRLYQKVGEQFEDFRWSVMKQELLLEVGIIAAAGLISGGVAWVAAPSAIGAASVGTATTLQAVGALALEATAFTAAEKGIRGYLYYEARHGANPFKDSQGNWIGAGDFAFDTVKMMGLMKSVRMAIGGYKSLMAGRTVLKNSTAVALLDDALKAGGPKTQAWLMQKLTEQKFATIKSALKIAGHKIGMFGAEFAGLQAWNNVGTTLDVLYQNLRYGQEISWSQAIAQTNSLEALSHGGAVLVGLKLSGIATGPLHQKAMGRRGKQAVHNANLKEFNTLISHLEGKLNQPGAVFDGTVQAKLNRLTQLGDQIHGVGQALPAYLQDSQRQWLAARPFLAQGLKLEVRGKEVNHSLQAAKEKLPKDRETIPELRELLWDGFEALMLRYGPRPSVLNLVLSTGGGLPVGGPRGKLDAAKRNAAASQTVARWIREGELENGLNAIREDLTAGRNLPFNGELLGAVLIKTATPDKIDSFRTALLLLKQMEVKHPDTFKQVVSDIVSRPTGEFVVTLTRVSKDPHTYPLHRNIAKALLDSIGKQHRRTAPQAKSKGIAPQTKFENAIEKQREHGIPETLPEFPAAYGAKLIQLAHTLAKQKPHNSPIKNARLAVYLLHIFDTLSAEAKTFQEKAYRQLTDPPKLTETRNKLQAMLEASLNKLSPEDRANVEVEIKRIQAGTLFGNRRLTNNVARALAEGNWQKALVEIKGKKGFDIYHGFDPEFTAGALAYLTQIFVSLQRNPSGFMLPPTSPTPPPISVASLGLLAFVGAKLSVLLTNHAEPAIEATRQGLTEVATPIVRAGIGVGNFSELAMVLGAGLFFLMASRGSSGAKTTPPAPQPPPPSGEQPIQPKAPSPIANYITTLNTGNQDAILRAISNLISPQDPQQFANEVRVALNLPKGSELDSTAMSKFRRETLNALLGHPDRELQSLAKIGVSYFAKALAKNQSIEALGPYLESWHPAVRWTIYDTLRSKMTPEQFKDFLREWRESEIDRVRAELNSENALTQGYAKKLRGLFFSPTPSSSSDPKSPSPLANPAPPAKVRAARARRKNSSVFSEFTEPSQDRASQPRKTAEKPRSQVITDQEKKLLNFNRVYLGILENLVGQSDKVVEHIQLLLEANTEKGAAELNRRLEIKGKPNHPFLRELSKQLIWNLLEHSNQELRQLTQQVVEPFGESLGKQLATRAKARPEATGDRHQSIELPFEMIVLTMRGWHPAIRWRVYQTMQRELSLKQFAKFLKVAAATEHEQRLPDELQSEFPFTREYAGKIQNLLPAPGQQTLPYLGIIGFIDPSFSDSAKQGESKAVEGARETTPDPTIPTLHAGIGMGGFSELALVLGAGLFLLMAGGGKKRKEGKLLLFPSRNGSNQPDISKLASVYADFIGSMLSTKNKSTNDAHEKIFLKIRELISPQDPQKLIDEINGALHLTEGSRLDPARIDSFRRNALQALLDHPELQLRALAQNSVALLTKRLALDLANQNELSKLAPYLESWHPVVRWAIYNTLRSKMDPKDFKDFLQSWRLSEQIKLETELNSENYFARKHARMIEGLFYELFPPSDPGTLPPAAGVMIGLSGTPFGRSAKQGESKTVEGARETTPDPTIPILHAGIGMGGFSELGMLLGAGLLLLMARSGKGDGDGKVAPLFPHLKIVPKPVADSRNIPHQRRELKRFLKGPASSDVNEVLVDLFEPAKPIAPVVEDYTAILHSAFEVGGRDRVKRYIEDLFAPPYETGDRFIPKLLANYLPDVYRGTKERILEITSDPAFLSAMIERLTTHHDSKFKSMAQEHLEKPVMEYARYLISQWLCFKNNNVFNYSSAAHPLIRYAILETAKKTLEPHFLKTFLDQFVAEKVTTQYQDPLAKEYADKIRTLLEDHESGTEEP